MARRDYEHRWDGSPRYLAALACCRVCAPAPAHAGGFFDFFFGDSQDQQPSRPPPPAYAEPSAPVLPAPLGSGERAPEWQRHRPWRRLLRRLCDGQHFPLEHMANATPVETCRAMCPASQDQGLSSAAKSALPSPRTARITPISTRRSSIASRSSPIAPATARTARPGAARLWRTIRRCGRAISSATKEGLMAYTGKNGRPRLHPGQFRRRGKPAQCRVRAASK